MGTSETALTAHLVMPQVQADDAFLQQASERLHARFGIGHVTLQVVRSPFMKGCIETVEPASNPTPSPTGS
jgi:cobalt-zinc-cadmium efflux system protein